MRVERKERTENVSVNELSAGACFEYNDSIYMLVDLSELDNRCPSCNDYLNFDALLQDDAEVAAVALSGGNGWVYSFTDEIVTPLNFKLVEV